MEDFFELMLELDHLSFKPILEAAGQQFDPEFRKAEIQQHIRQGARFVLVFSEGKIVAYAEYLPLNERIGKIFSLQIHPDFRGGMTLRRLLVAAWDEWKDVRQELIWTTVHLTNAPSLALHRSLGFVEINREDGKVFFEIPRKVLVARLARLRRKRWKNKQKEKIMTHKNIPERSRR